VIRTGIRIAFDGNIEPCYQIYSKFFMWLDDEAHDIQILVAGFP
jgi:hypothetical protein